MTTGKDNIDDAQALIASLRSQVAEQRELLERVAGALDARTSADWNERATWERRANDDAAIICVDAGAALAVAGAIAAIRAHLAGAAVPGESGHVFAIGDVVRVTGDTGKTGHEAPRDEDGVIVELANGNHAKWPGVSFASEGPDEEPWYVHPRDLVLVRKAGT